MATRTVSNTGGNYNATGTWVEAAVPTSADTVVFTSTSGQLTVNVASQAGSINFSGYTGTTTLSNTLSVFGNINFGTGGYNVSGSSSLIIASASTITSNGVAWKSNLQFGTTSQTIILNDIVVSRGTLSRIIRFEVYVDKKLYTVFLFLFKVF